MTKRLVLLAALPLLLGAAQRSGTVSPTSNVVVGDCTTNDTVRFQAAVTASAGRTLIGIGCFKITSINLIGNVVYDFRAAKFIRSSVASGAGMFDASAISDVTILGGWYTYDGSSVTVVNNGRTYTDGTALWIHNGSSRITVVGGRYDRHFTSINVYASSQVHISNTEMVNTNAGISFLADATGVVNECSAVNNDIQSADDGIAVQTRENNDVTNVVVLGNRLNKSHLDGSAQAAVGIRVARENPGVGTGKPKGVVVEGNVLSQMVADGILFDDVDGITVRGNTVRGFGRGAFGANGRGIAAGLTSQPVTKAVIAGNLVTGGAATTYWGIKATELADSIITDNVVQGNAAGTGGGIDLFNSTHNLITSNRAWNTDAASNGIHARGASSANNVIAFNNVTGSASWGAQGTGATDITYANVGGTLGSTFAATGGISPSKDDLSGQTGKVFQGSGVPNNANGNNGDFYFRTDTPGVANQRVYNRQAGAWVGIL